MPIESIHPDDVSGGINCPYTHSNRQYTQKNTFDVALFGVFVWIMMMITYYTRFRRFTYASMAGELLCITVLVALTNKYERMSFVCTAIAETVEMYYVVCIENMAIYSAMCALCFQGKWIHYHNSLRWGGCRAIRWQTIVRRYNGRQHRYKHENTHTVWNSVVFPGKKGWRIVMRIYVWANPRILLDDNPTSNSEQFRSDGNQSTSWKPEYSFFFPETQYFII